METVGLRIGVSKFGIYLWFTKGFASHLQIANEFIMLARMAGDLDYLSEIRRVLGFDVRIYCTVTQNCEAYVQTVID
jgi:hypothetical protein